MIAPRPSAIRVCPTSLGCEVEFPCILMRRLHAPGRFFIMNPDDGHKTEHGETIPTEKKGKYPWMLTAKSEHCCSKGNVG